MQTPICEVCLKSDMLCSACNEKLQSNKITQSEINISRFIYGLSEKIKSLQQAKIEKVIESNIILIIARKGDGAKLVGKGGTVVKALAKQFGKSIKIVEQSGNYREFIQNLISPVSVNGVNTVFSVGGERYKIRIASSHRNSLSLKSEDIADISRSLFKKEAEVVFEN